MASKAWLPQAHFETVCAHQLLAPGLDRAGLAEAALPRILCSLHAGHAAVLIDKPIPCTLHTLDVCGDRAYRVALGPLRSRIQEQKKQGSPVLVDNSHIGPWLCRPLQMGADAVLEDLSTWLGLAGWILIARTDASLEELLSEAGIQRQAPGSHCPGTGAGQDSTQAGATAGQVPLPSAEELALASAALRSQHRCDLALVVASYLDKHPFVQRVDYPGLASDSSYEPARSTLEHGSGPVLSFALNGAGHKDCGTGQLDTLIEELRKQLADMPGDASFLELELRAAPAESGQAGQALELPSVSCMRSCLVLTSALTAVFFAGLETPLDVVHALDRVILALLQLQPAH